MKEQLLPISFPMGGLHVSTAYADQPDGTTAACLNVQGLDPRTGRDRGAQREGLTKFCPTQIAGNNPVQEITKAVATSLAPGTVLPSNSLLGVFAYSGENNPNACILSTPDFQHQIGVGSGQPLGYCWDNSNRFYTAVRTGGNTVVQAFKVFAAPNGAITANAYWTSASLPNSNATLTVGMTFGLGFLWVATMNAGNTAVFVYKLSVADGTIVTGTHVYTSASVFSTRAVRPLAYANGKLFLGYTLGVLDIVDAVAFTHTTVTDFAQDVLDLGSDGTFAYAVNMQPDFGAGSVQCDIYQMNSVAFKPWGVTEGVHNILNSNLDASVTFDPVSNVIFTGHGGDSGFSGSSNTGWHLGKFGAGDGKEITTTGGGPYRSVSADGLGNFYACQPQAWGSVTPTALIVEKHSSSLQQIASFNTGTANTGVPRFVAVNLGAQVGAGTGLSPRFIRPLGCSAGNIRKFNRMGITQITGGELAMSATAPVVFSSQLANLVLFVDGIAYKTYDTIADKVSTLVASSGSLPVSSSGAAARLCTVWRNCMVLAGIIDDPFNWFISALQDMTNWNYNPTPAVESMAVAGNNVTSSTPVGESPDVINALCPYSDEILLFFGDHTVHQMTGHPAAGGRIDLVTDGIGGAWGRPFCRDGQGRLYFFSSRGTIYQFVPGSVPEPISGNIRELLLTVDLGQFVVRMAWNERHLAFHVWLTPIAGPGPTQHYKYDTRTQAWWPVQYASPNFDPLCVLEFDGDTVADRVILLGCQDGFVRELDVNALDDDGVGMNSYVRIGPLKSGTALYEADLQCTLDQFSSPVNYAIFKGAYAQQALSDPNPRLGQFNPGRNRSQSLRVFGHYLYLQLANRQLAKEAWALDELKARVRVPEGKTRERVFNG